MESGEIMWAREEFGSAALGDERRTKRLVAVVAGVAGQPAGRVTEVFGTQAERRGAYRLMEAESFSSQAVAEAAHRASARRCSGQPWVFVPVDGSSLNLADWSRSKGLGVVGARYVGARGLQVMTAMAVASDGTPLGLAGQTWWARVARVVKKKKDRRQVHERETHHWLVVMNQVRSALAAEAAGCQPWFQLDRGGDAWPVLLDGLEPGQLFTVRAARDRRLQRAQDEPRRYLWQQVEEQPVLGRYELQIAREPGRQARSAQIEVRACQVTLDLKQYNQKRHFSATLWAVLAAEVGPVRTGDKKLEWLLLTSHPVATFQDAQQVIYGYAQRWRIEEFHRIWKTGACRVEDTQLRDREAIIKWATILASTAVRLLRMTYLARGKPDVPATTELSQPEVDAIVLLKKPAGFKRGDVPPIGRAVLWLAELGGYTGKSSGGPPGAIVICRGLERIQSLAQALADGL